MKLFVVVNAAGAKKGVFVTQRSAELAFPCYPVHCVETLPLPEAVIEVVAGYNKHAAVRSGAKRVATYAAAVAWLEAELGASLA